MAVYRSLRLLPALLAFSFVLTVAAPAVAYACTMDAATCCCGHGEGAVCPTDAAPTPDVPSEAEACCAAHPAGPLAERALVPPALTLAVPALPVLWTLAPMPPPPETAVADSDTGPPSVRPHLAFAVLLI